MWHVIKHVFPLTSLSEDVEQDYVVASTSPNPRCAQSLIQQCLLHDEVCVKVSYLSIRTSGTGCQGGS